MSNSLVWPWIPVADLKILLTCSLENGNHHCFIIQIHLLPEEFYREDYLRENTLLIMFSIENFGKEYLSFFWKHKLIWPCEYFPFQQVNSTLFENKVLSIPFKLECFEILKGWDYIFSHHFISIAKCFSWHKESVFWVNECVRTLFISKGDFGYQPLGYESRRIAANFMALENSMM